MTFPSGAAPAVFLPENAPFSPEQRSWLSGFFAGLIGFNGAGAGAAQAGAPVAENDDEAPWHDQTIALPERMKLAEGRPLRRRMMAAMAQQDCGQCGYDCKTYADVLHAGKEARLNLCIPGGKETARMLRKLYEERDAAPAAGNLAIAVVDSSLAGAVTRDRPVPARLLSRKRLNGTGSEKETWHIEFDLTGTGLNYAAGDSLGLYPRNSPMLVQSVIAAIGAAPDAPVNGRTLREVLRDSLSLNPAPDSLFQLVSCLTGGERRLKAKALAAGEDPDGDAGSLDVLAVLQKFPQCRPDPEAFVEALEPLQPRLYSISSSPRIDPARVSITVDAVRYSVGGRERLGVASTYLATRAKPGEQIHAYVQKAHGFALPADPSVPIIMVGPGTGIAPFRAFLQERVAAKAPGKNWLFFGHQRSACDFFYSDELNAWRKAGVLELALAWSRDGDQKIYVQDRMRDRGRQLWQLLAEGAHFYVCGDAKRMAKDVERALVDIVADFGARSSDEAIAFVAQLKRAGRYQTDVY